MKLARVIILLAASVPLMGFYVGDRLAFEDGECGVPTGTFICKIGGQKKPLRLTEKAAGNGSSCIYVDPADNTEGRFKRISGKLYLAQTSPANSNGPAEFAFMEANGKGWNLYLQDPGKVKQIEKRLATTIANDAERIKRIIEKDGDISASPDPKSGTEKLSGPKELILLILMAHDRSVLKKVGSCVPAT